MEHRDKIFDQFKIAAQNVATKEFPTMENVWTKIEEKLDTKVLKKENKTWKKIAIAASLLLCISVGYQFFKTKNELSIPHNQVVTNEKDNVILDSETDEVLNENKNIPKKSEEVLNKIIQSENDVASIDVPQNNSPILIDSSPVGEAIAAQEIVLEKPQSSPKKADDKSNNAIFKTKIYDARGVQNSYEVVENKTKEEVGQKANPLYVIDGEAVADNKNADGKSKLDKNDIHNIEILKEPLYIINGVQYSEDELFGENPTSPYAPLEKQEIIKTKVYQGQEAEELYGEKGKKGVVVITTKYGKPVKK